MPEFETKLVAIFEERFSGYRLPFNTADTEIAKLDVDAKKQYTEDAGRLLKSDLWRIELGELYRNFFHILAFSSLSEEERTAYRLTITLLDQWETRLQSISKLKDAVNIAANQKDNA